VQVGSGLLLAVAIILGVALFKRDNCAPLGRMVRFRVMGL